MQVSSGRPHILTSHQRGRGKEPVVVLGRIKLAVAVNMASSGRRDYTSQQGNVLWNLGATPCEPACVSNELGSAPSNASAAAAVRGSSSRPLAAIFWGGLLAGIFDITQAFVGFRLLGAKPFRILQHIAGGIFGARSMQMGWTSAGLGLVFHFT